MRGHKRLPASLLLGATLVAACGGIAIAYASSAQALECPLSTRYSCGGGPEVAWQARFNPIRLPKGRLAPIHFDLGGKVDAPAETNPPRLEKVVLETDRNVAVYAKGLPVCRPSIEVWNPCESARVGKGELEVEVDFTETQPFTVAGHARVLNFGVRNGAKTIAMVAYLPNPVSASVVIWIKVSKVRHGRYGIRWVATIPMIEGGYGRVKSFDLDLFRRFGYRHKKRSYLLAKCPDGKLQASVESTLGEVPPRGAAIFLSPCTPVG